MALLPFSRVTGKTRLPDSSTILQSFDARDWAKHFVNHVKANPSIVQDEGTMIAWFANAIMRGWDERERRFDEELKQSGQRRLDHMTKQGIREAVAQGWCADVTSQKTMDPDLADAIVDRLMDLTASGKT